MSAVVQQQNVVVMEHPKAAAAKAAAIAKKVKEHAEEEHCLALIAKHRLRFVHDAYLGVTIAFQLPVRRRVGVQVVKFAVANVHPNDTFSKQIGRQVAAAKFDRGQFTEVKMDNVVRSIPDSLRLVVAVPQD